MRIVGYTDPLSIAPGGTLSVMVSAEARDYSARVVRLAGRREEPVPAIPERRAAGVRRSLPLGSHLRVAADPALSPVGSFSLRAWAFPTAPEQGIQGIIARWSDSEARGWALVIDETGSLALWLGAGPGRVLRLSSGSALAARTWYAVAASVDPEAGRAWVAWAPPGWPSGPSGGRAEARLATRPEPVEGPLVIGALDERPTGVFEGKLEAPALLADTIEPGAGEPADPAAIARWDFSRDLGARRVVDASGNGHDAVAVNLPTRAVTGRSWSGREVDPRADPGGYAAIHFHSDDLEDAGWDADLEIELPAGLASGVYGVRLEGDGALDVVPFFVRPPRGHADAEAALLMPTLSYMAYANEHASWAKPIPSTPGIDAVLARVGERDRFAHDQRLLSLYELHADGSGVCLSSRLRPIVNMRADYRMPLIDGPHQFSADMELLAWLNTHGHPHDVVTDEDLHAEGAELLRRYRVVLSGSHPEYWTYAMLDGLQQYLDGGGRFMYLGGNGLYWVTSIDPEHPHVIEVRRGHAGTRVWASEPGEVHHQTTGEAGGLWMHRGRSPHRLLGVGFSGQGFDRSLPYHRAEDASDPRVAWVLDGVPEGPIGVGGSVLGGAAGFEIDRLDHGHGSPASTLRLASADGFSDAYQGVVEDILTADSQQGGTVNPGVRADMTLVATPSAGAVFSTGSIAWCGALGRGPGENAVSRITDNVLRRFLEPGPPLGTDRAAAFEVAR